MAFQLRTLLINVISIVALGASAQPQFNGEWYGTMYGCDLTVEFTADSIMRINSAANSQMQLESPFSITQSHDRYDIDLNNPVGLSALGIASFEDPEHLDIALAFKFGDWGARPETFEEVEGNPAALRLSLTRNKEETESVLSQKVIVPKEAQLPFERNKQLGQGLCLNGCVDANPVDGNDYPLQESDFAQIAEAGFNSIRVPVAWVKHCANSVPYTIDPDFFAKIDWIIVTANKYGLVVTIDQHYYPYINMNEDDPDLTWEENIQRLKSMWEQIAVHYKDYSNELLYFDLLNEPNMRIGAEGLNSLHSDLIEIIRKTNPERTLLVGTPNLGQSWTLGELKLPDDDWNIIVQAHYYLPYTFTHQNLSYVPNVASQEKVEWNGTERELIPIINDMDFCRKWSDCTGRPVNIGEYGVCRNADKESASRYLTFMQEQFRSHGFSSHLWGYRGLFGLYDHETGVWNKDLLNALNITK